MPYLSPSTITIDRETMLKLKAIKGDESWNSFLKKIIEVLEVPVDSEVVLVPSQDESLSL